MPTNTPQNGGTQVSIPFKREGAWKASVSCITCLATDFVSIPFKREGAWKAGKPFLRSILISKTKCVSIPFKREGAWKAHRRRNPKFPRRVSIPFKREGAWKVKRKALILKLTQCFCFNSLQTGRSMERNNKRYDTRIIHKVSIPFKREGAWKDEVYSEHVSSDEIQKFQFPSNGKEHGKQQTWFCKRWNNVSIPFKREGAWKV